MVRKRTSILSIEQYLFNSHSEGNIIVNGNEPNRGLNTIMSYSVVNLSTNHDRLAIEYSNVHTVCLIASEKYPV
jgi:hypothetical protein